MNYQLYEASLDQNGKAEFPGKVILSGLSLEEACVMLECAECGTARMSIGQNTNKYWYILPNVAGT